MKIFVPLGASLPLAGKALPSGLKFGLSLVLLRMRRIAGGFYARHRGRARNRGTNEAMHELRLDRSHGRFHLCRLRRLVKRYKASLEVIAEDAGDRLRKAAGIGALLK